MASKPHDNFATALTKLAEFCSQYKGSEIERAGVIQAFEFTFEQCWKALQKIAGNEGLSFASPKTAFEWALSAGLILNEEEESWIAMLSDRNLTTHTYREKTATEVFDRITKIYLQCFQKILVRLNQRK